MLTYNHEKYVARAIESVLTQVVSFRIELIIGDDASTDNTQEIIRNYALQYPCIINSILRSENVGTMENSFQLRNLCKGKYTISLEGDDYWTDNNKLQVQVDFLETHPDFFSVAHRHEIIDENDNLLGISLNFINKDTIFTKKDAIKYGPSLLHPNSVMYYNFYPEKEDVNLFFKSANSYGGHSLLVYYLASQSDIYILEKPMSVWRKVENSTADNFTSYAKKNQLDISVNDVIKYDKYRTFFGKEYDFSFEVRKKFIIFMIRLSLSKITLHNKITIFMRVFKTLRFKDIALLSITLITMLYKRAVNIVKKLKIIESSENS